VGNILATIKSATEVPLNSYTLTTLWFCDNYSTDTNIVVKSVWSFYLPERVTMFPICTEKKTG